MTGALVRRGSEDPETQKEGHVGTQKVSLRKPRRETPEEVTRANSLISHFWPPELRENKFLLFKPLSLQSFITTVRAN